MRFGANAKSLCNGGRSELIHPRDELVGALEAQRHLANSQISGSNGASPLGTTKLTTYRHVILMFHADKAWLVYYPNAARARQINRNLPNNRT